MRDLEFKNQDKPAHLVQSHIHPSLWFSVEGSLDQPHWIPPCDHSLRSDLERVNTVRSQELSLPAGTILVNQMEYIVEVMKFEPSLQLKSRTSPGNQENFATRTKSSPQLPTPEEQAEHLEALQALMQDEIVEPPKLHYNSEQNVTNLPATVCCLNWIH